MYQFVSSMVSAPVLLVKSHADGYEQWRRKDSSIQTLFRHKKD